MSFRRDRDASLKWQRWLEQNRDELIACGIPLLVLEEESNWFYFLEHGYFTPSGLTEPIINVETMDRPKAERLCIFLEDVGCDYPSSDALIRLQYLLKRGRHGSEEAT
jgi:hypothetical protein